MLDIKGLTKRYGGQVVLRAFSATFAPRQIHVIIGASGSGKTTLMHCISGLEPFEEGTILLESTLLAEPHGRRSAQPTEVGYVLQGFSLFSHLTVLDNLTLAPRLVYSESRMTAEDRAMALLDKMQLADRAHAYPNQLSGGQQQRVAIARAIMMNPKILLLDEPTTALDPQLVLSLERTLKALVADGLTLLVSTHHLAFAKHIADTTIFLSHGEIIEASPGADLLRHPRHPEIQAFIQQEEGTLDAGA